MAKKDYFFRYLTIIKALRRMKVASYEEIYDFMKSEAELNDYLCAISSRTFQRDLNEIRSLFKVDIQYDFSLKVYQIIDDQQNEMNNRMLESIDTINSLKMVTDVSKYMFFEKRLAHGTQHFYGLLHAIKGRLIINLVYQKFLDDEPTERFVAPLALKEAKGRWYLLAREQSGTRIKTFGLDRIFDFEITPKRFDYPQNFDVDEIFRFCFGVINPDGAEPEEIRLSFDFEQGKYIKSYPIHESQTILADNEEGLRISLKLLITYDLIMEILSYGDSVSIISPEKLIKKVVNIHCSAIRKSTGSKEILA
ncbi:MAG: WYL domain-containing protein [Bacteroidales bacterium]|jgi:predicted DNA-binding transcriptional regulator YafY|nr:WYL domain-containing protein [Bacteroidales bacterium]